MNPDSMGTLLILAFLAGIAGLALLWWNNPSKLLERGDQARALGNRPRAERLYTRAAERLRKASGPKLLPLRAKAHQALGDLHVASGRDGEAVDRYKAAVGDGATLPVQARQFLAEYHAAQKDTSDEAAIEYIACLERQREQAPAPVFEMLRQMCTIRENTSVAERQISIERNRRIAALVPRTEWPHFYLGFGLLLGARYGEASESFARALELNPDRKMTYYWLGVCRLQLPEVDLEGAIEMLDVVIEAPAENDTTRRRQGNAAHEIAKRLRSSDAKRAKCYARKAVTVHPEQASYHFLYGQILLDLDEPDAALHAIETASQLAPEEFPYLQLLASEYEGRGANEKAIEVLENLAALRRDIAETEIALARLYFGAARFAEAEPRARAALRLSPQDNNWCRTIIVRSLYCLDRFEAVAAEVTAWPAVSADQPFDTEMTFAIGHSFSLVGDVSRARQWLTSNTGDERHWYHGGCAAAHLQEFGAAEHDFTRVVERGARYVTSAFIQRGHVYRSQGQANEAVSDYQSALERAPDSAAAAEGLAMVLLESGKPQDALSAVGSLCSPRAMFLAGLACERLAQWEQAIEHYRAVGSDATLGGPTSARLGILYCQRGDYSSTLQSLSRVPENERETDAVLFYRGVALTHSDRPAEGLEDLQELLKRHPGEERIRVNVARAQYLQGAQAARKNHWREAIAAWEAYLEVFPSDQGVAADVASLYALLAEQALESGARTVKDARDLAGHALQWCAEHVPARYIAALCALRSGDAEQCLHILSALEQEVGTDPATQYLRAIAALHCGQRPAAEEMLSDLVNRANGSRHGMLARAVLANERLRDGDIEAALALL